MIKFDLHKVEDLALIGVLLSRNIYPIQGSNYINNEGKREQFAYYQDSIKKELNGAEDTPEYKSAYLMAVFITQARKQVPLVVHTLPNKKQIIIPADMKKEQIQDLIRRM